MKQKWWTFKRDGEWFFDSHKGSPFNYGDNLSILADNYVGRIPVWKDEAALKNAVKDWNIGEATPSLFKVVEMTPQNALLAKLGLLE